MIGRRGLVIAAVAAVAVLAFVSLVPYPNAYDVDVTVSITEIQALIVSYYQINSVTGSTYGHSAILDWHALLGGSLTFGALSAQFKLTVCAGGHCVSSTAGKLVPSFPTNTGTVSNTLVVGYVPGGQQTLSATLYENGNSVAQGSGSLCVGC